MLGFRYDHLHRLQVRVRGDEPRHTLVAFPHGLPDGGRALRCPHRSGAAHGRQPLPHVRPRHERARADGGGLPGPAANLQIHGGNAGPLGPPVRRH